MTRRDPHADRSTFVARLIMDGWQLRPQTGSTLSLSEWICSIARGELRCKVSLQGQVRVTNASRTIALGYDATVPDDEIIAVLASLAAAEG